jgi:hypothetical protein
MQVLGRCPRSAAFPFFVDKLLSRHVPRVPQKHAESGDRGKPGAQPSGTDMGDGSSTAVDIGKDATNHRRPAGKVDE